jgi:hypothetical protein
MSNNDFGKFLWEEQKVDLDTLLQNEHLDQIINDYNTVHSKTT